MNDTPNNSKDIQTLSTNTETNNLQGFTQDNSPNYPQNNPQINTGNSHNDINNTNQTFSARFHACIDMMAEISNPPEILEQLTRSIIFQDFVINLNVCIEDIETEKSKNK
ncbi:MAG: hypothetical protein ACRBCK_07705 [Alphaproteobacteria bacterium]